VLGSLAIGFSALPQSLSPICLRGNGRAAMPCLDDGVVSW
jgi:hypothetical protein